MSSSTTASIVIHTSPEEVPSIPSWFAEVVVLARHFTRQGHLDAISQRVRLARGRAGTFDVLDFVAILLGYAVSGEPTLEAFFDRLDPFAGPFMALFGRDQLPHRATLSRFVEAPVADHPLPAVVPIGVDNLVPTYGPLELSQPWAKARRRFSAQDFTLGEDDTLTCPTGKVLRPRERRTMPNGDLRVLYAAKMHDCRTCRQAGACLGRGASGE